MLTSNMAAKLGVNLNPPTAFAPSSIDRLRSFGQEQIDEFDRSGAGELERTIIAQGGRRSLGDIARIGTDAGAMSDRAYTSAGGIAERQRRGLGQTATAGQQTSFNRRMGLARALGNVDSRNRALMADQSRRNVIRSSASGLRDIIDRQIYANLEGSANIEAGIEHDAAAGKANRSAQMASTTGSSLGMILSMFGGK